MATVIYESRKFEGRAFASKVEQLRRGKQPYKFMTRIYRPPLLPGNAQDWKGIIEVEHTFFSFVFSMTFETLIRSIAGVIKF